MTRTTWKDWLLAIAIGTGLALALTEWATAQTVGVHLVSHHAPKRDFQRNDNPGLYFRSAEGWTVGAYRNTIGRTSVYAGRAFAVGPLDIGLGVVGGYQRKCHETTWNQVDTQSWEHHGRTYSRTTTTPMVRTECLGVSRGYLSPMVSPSIALPAVLGATPRLHYMPGLSGTSNVIHLSVEWSMQ